MRLNSQIPYTIATQPPMIALGEHIGRKLATLNDGPERDRVLRIYRTLNPTQKSLADLYSIDPSIPHGWAIVEGDKQ